LDPTEPWRLGSEILPKVNRGIDFLSHAWRNMTQGTEAIFILEISVIWNNTLKKLLIFFSNK
jgi:hypothetical protein